ncbi:MAG: polyphosphate kinase 2 family protein [Acetobacteraceae bacterium]|nr:polyphosphate kinase 2 family protein [Acetobacteraceae bacterium]
MTTARHHALILTQAPTEPFGGIDPDDTHDIGHEAAEMRLDKARGKLAELHAKMKASETWALLAIFQGMDAGGKDSAIAHIFGGLDPGALQVTSFKRPSAMEALHDILWREHQAVPHAGQWGIFNRSHYENVLVPRVHPENGPARRLPASLTGPNMWRDQLEDIVHFERMLSRNGVKLCKFFLHISPEEQRKRLLARLDDPHKAWKFEAADLIERQRWDAYQLAYQDVIAATATPFAPWAVIPANSKPVARALMAEILVDQLSGLDIAVPEPDPDVLRQARQALDKAS